MDIHIKTIPDNEQKYKTAGDWWFEPNSLEIRVSDMDNREYEFLLAIHELIEAFLCMQKEITEQEVTRYDMEFEQWREIAPDIVGDMEPGDMTSAPYHEQHQFATQMERQISQQLGIDWKKYEKKVNSL